MADQRLPTPLPREIVEEAHGGYDCALVEPPPAMVQTECPICLLILKQPCLTSCCGCKVCQTCIDGVRKKALPCPHCNKDYFTIMRERELERQLKELKVFCSYKNYSCNWEGKLRDLDTHLDCDQSHEGQVTKCECVAVKCIYQCGDWFQRRDITVHQTMQCKQRPYTCEHCEDYQSTFENVTEIHHPECYKYPVPCPNSCQSDLFQRQDLEDHLEYECPLTIIDCPFKYAGCEVELPRREMPNHMSHTVEHLVMLGSVTKRLMEENEELHEREIDYDDQETVAERFRQIIVAREDELQESIAELELRVRISEDKLRENEDTIQELLQRVQESADRPDTQSTADDLQQSLRVSEAESHQNLMIQELEQKVSNNKDEVIKVTDELKQHTEDMNKLYRQLLLKQKTIEEAVKNSKEDTYKQMPPTLGLPLDFHIEKRNETIYLSPFCTHPHGYQMCIRVDPDGHGRGKGTHISIFTYIMQGPFDNDLKWPFYGEITIQILNQARDDHHVKKTIVYDDKTPNTAADRVVGKVRSEKGRGHTQFLAHDALSLRETQYLKDNHFIVRIVKVLLA